MLDKLKNNDRIFMINVTHKHMLEWSSGLNQLYCNVYGQGLNTGISLDDEKKQIFNKCEVEVKQFKKLFPLALGELKYLVYK